MYVCGVHLKVFYGESFVQSNRPFDSQAEIYARSCSCNMIAILDFKLSFGVVYYLCSISWHLCILLVMVEVIYK